jgi:4-amino-4-deoxychorismate lyase
MHEFVSFNRQIFRSNQVKINGISSATLYGSGIFTTIAVYNSKPFLWEKHWQRLTENAFRIGIDFLQFSEEIVKNELLEILKHNKVENGRARLTFFDESSTEIWQTSNLTKTSLLITTGDFRPIPQNLDLTVSPYCINSTSPLINTKSSNYLENLLALREAKQRGFDEAVRLNEKNEVVSACMSNIFGIKDGEVFTPTLETGALQGTMRDFILENFSVTEIKVTLTELKSAECIFLTSAGLGVVEIKTFDSKTYLFSNIFQKIQQCFNKIKETIK